MAWQLLTVGGIMILDGKVASCLMVLASGRTGKWTSEHGVNWLWGCRL